MDIKVGEYIRTRGIIGKLIRIEKDEVDISLKWYVFLGKDEFGIEKELYVNKPYIEKHSKNIIDLIEVGDFVNGYRTMKIDYKEKYIIIQDIKETGESGIKILTENEIESILTKEQYKQNCYKLEKVEEER